MLAACPINFSSFISLIRLVIDGAKYEKSLMDYFQAPLF